MRHLSTILMLAFACLLPAHAVNLLTNGGFANDGTRIPDWSLPGNEATIDAENFPPEEPGDRQALRIETRRQWAVAEAEFTVAGGLEYLVSYWQRLENATQTHVKLAWFNRDGVLFEETFLSYGQDGTRPWTRHENRLTAPAQAIRCLFRIWAGGTSEQPGISWFDEINISPVDEEAHQQAVEARDAIPVVQRALPPNSMKPRGEAVEVHPGADRRAQGELPQHRRQDPGQRVAAAAFCHAGVAVCCYVNFSVGERHHGAVVFQHQNAAGARRKPTCFRHDIAGILPAQPDELPAVGRQDHRSGISPQQREHGL